MQDRDQQQAQAVRALQRSSSSIDGRRHLDTCAPTIIGRLAFIDAIDALERTSNSTSSAALTLGTSAAWTPQINRTFIKQAVHRAVLGRIPVRWELHPADMADVLARAKPPKVPSPDPSRVHASSFVLEEVRQLLGAGLRCYWPRGPRTSGGGTGGGGSAHLLFAAEPPNTPQSVDVTRLVRLYGGGTREP